MSHKEKSKQLSARKYFLFSFKKYISNENKILYKNFLPSIREILLDYINTYEDSVDNNIKLEKSKNDIIDAVIFFSQESIFYKKGSYKEELDLLIDDLRKIRQKSLDKTEEGKIYNRCTAMVKKISKDDIYTDLCNIIKSLSSFEEVDRAIQTSISEMLYDGYSLKYIENWYNDNVAKELTDLTDIKIENLINKFSGFNIDETIFKYFITIKTTRNLREKIYLDCNLIMEQVDFENINLINNEDGKDAKNYLQYGANTLIYSIEVKAKDCYKALEILIDSLNSYFQMDDYINEENQLLINQKVVVEL